MKDKLNYFKYKKMKDNYEVMVNRIANVRMIMFIIMIFSFILKYYYFPFVFNLVFVISFLMFIIMVLVHNKYFNVYDFLNKYVLVIEEYIARENGEWKNFLDKGEDFLEDDSNYYYLRDLDILGNNSLFQYLSICKTQGGRKRLFNKLSNLKFDEEELVNNQNLIKELCNNVDLMIKFQIIMNKSDIESFKLFSELNNFKSNTSKKKVDFLIGIVASFLCISLFLLGIFKVISLSYFYGMFFFNLIISYFYLYVYKEDFFYVDKLVKDYGKLVLIFDLFSGYKASSYKLKKIVKNILIGEGEIKKLKQLDSINSFKNNLVSNFLFNGLFCLNLFVRVKYINFINNSSDYLINIISDIYELEALISLANIGVVKNNICIPTYSDKLVLQFDEIRHPLINEEICVSNSFETKAGVNIITGSNMGGKTTFLRTIGINLILMQAGSYVCATNFKSSYFKIFTSMRVNDDIDKGISTFYGELIRIKDMVEYIGRDNMLVLVDEIFKGTNYDDRMYGAFEVVRKFNNKNTLAFITTHDFSLCESDNVKNYHVKEDYEGDKIIFDYKIREGRVVSTNAKYLMKKLNIID